MAAAYPGLNKKGKRIKAQIQGCKDFLYGCFYLPLKDMLWAPPADIFLHEALFCPHAAGQTAFFRMLQAGGRVLRFCCLQEESFLKKEGAEGWSLSVF